MHDSDGPLYLALIRLAVQLSLYRGSLSSLRYSSLSLLWTLILLFFFKYCTLNFRHFSHSHSHYKTLESYTHILRTYDDHD